jgi:hypothetical protein
MKVGLSLAPESNTQVKPPEGDRPPNVCLRVKNHQANSEYRVLGLA